LQLPEQYWFCDKTLRVDPRYVSVYIWALLLIMLNLAIVELISRFLDFLIMQIHIMNPKPPTAQRVGEANCKGNTTGDIAGWSAFKFQP